MPIRRKSKNSSNRFSRNRVRTLSPCPRSNTLIVTDYATNLVKIAKWVESIDKPKALVAVEFVRVEHQAVADLTTQLTAVLAAKSRAGGVGEVTPDVEIVPDQHTNQLLVIGPQATVQEVKELVESLDKPLGLITKTYQFTNVRATKIDELVRALVDAERRRPTVPIGHG